MSPRPRLVALLILALCCLGPRPSAAQPSVLAHERYALDNGLDVVLHVDRSLPMVALDLSYHVGSMHDGRDQGIAHLVEHLMFRGTPNVEDGELPKTMQEAGAIFNATTMQGRTSYHATLPTAQLPMALWLESDRMAYLLPALTDVKVREEIATTTAEWRTKIEGTGFGLAHAALMDALFPPGHPLDNADPQMMAALTLAEAQAFVRHYHGPANATLVLAGDLPADVRDQVQRYFGKRSGGAGPSPVRVAAPAATGEQRVTLRSAVAATALVGLGWLTPALYTPGDAEADLLATLLEPELELALEAAAPGKFRGLEVRQASFDGVSRFTILAEGAPGSLPLDMLAILDRALGQLLASPVDPTQLRRAQRTMSLASLRALQSLEGRASRMQLYIAAGKDPDWLDEDLDRYAAATPDALASFAATHLASDKRVVVLAYPAEGA